MVLLFFHASNWLLKNSFNVLSSPSSIIESNGITHLLTPPHTPEHNGSAEQLHRHVKETGVTLLHHTSIPLKFWTNAFLIVVYLINCMPTPILYLHSPFEKLFGRSPNYEKLRVFGSLCYPWLKSYSNHNVDPKSKLPNLNSLPRFASTSSPTPSVSCPSSLEPYFSVHEQATSQILFVCHPYQLLKWSFFASNVYGTSYALHFSTAHPHRPYCHTFPT